MTELLANEDLLVKFDNVAPGGLVYTGDLGVDQVTIKTTVSAKTKASSKGVCTTKVDSLFTAALVCPHTFAGHVFVAGAGVVALASATKCKADAFPVLRKGDAGTCIGSWTNTASGAVVPCSCTTGISDAGQDKTNGN